MKPKQLRIGVKKTLKLAYKINLRKAFAIILPKIRKMLFCNKRTLKKLIRSLVEDIQKYKSAVRNGRKFKRVFNSAKHSVNYKRNFLLV